jgi:hypothetical protein
MHCRRVRLQHTPVYFSDTAGGSEVRVHYGEIALL